jgi:hypothetical protein
LISRTQEGIQNQWTYHRPKVYPIKNNINIKKATGADGIPAKIIKCSKSIIAPQYFKYDNCCSKIFSKIFEKIHSTLTGL